MTDPRQDPSGAPKDPPPPEAASGPAAGSAPTPPPKDPLRGSRTSGLWIGLVVASVLLVLLIIFIAQNTEDVQVAFLGWEGETPLAVALLIAAAGGAIITAVAGSMRIWQLRRRVRREAK